MQTPADRIHWRGKPMGHGQEDIKNAAIEYISRCYEVGLEVIAITDHNYASKDFISLLRLTIQQLSAEFGYEIVLFPGFEFEADVGKGCHCLAIFAPESNLDDIDHLLTECGIPPPRFEDGQPKRSTKRLPEILERVQRRDRLGNVKGLVICPHAQGDSGIFDNDRISEWLQQEEFTNPNLHCIEVPKPPCDMSRGWQRLLRSGPECHEGWRRRRAIACVMSSDAKALRPEDGAENYIGYRHTWIKMSRPSIEALRQAFLDHESRIRFGPVRPEEAYQYSKITEMQVHNTAFLANQTIAFSPNLTTVIGGRGTGKSTLVEYLRLALDQESSIRGEEPQKNLQNLKRTLTAASMVKLELDKEGQPLTIENRGGISSVIVQGAAVPEIARFFRTRILSQREIYAIAQDKEARSRIVDDIVRTGLDELFRKGHDVVMEIKQLNQQIASLPDLWQREKELETERQDRKVRLKRLTALQAPLARWKGFLAEEQFFNSLGDEASGLVRSLRETVAEIELSSTVIGSELAEAMHHDLSKSVAERADQLVKELREGLEKAIALFDKSMSTLLTEEAILKWKKSLEKEREHFQKLRTELAEQGTDPDQYLNYQRELKELEVQLSEIHKRRRAIDLMKRSRDGGTDESGITVPGLIQDLIGLWKRETELRHEAAQRLENAIPKTTDGKPFLLVSIEPYGDQESFLSKLREEIKDGRRITRNDWDSFMKAIFITALQSDLPATELLYAWITQFREGQAPQGCPWPLDDRRLEVVLEWLTEERLQEIRLWRIPDWIRIELLRSDGSPVGELAGPELSVGQRCTAVLAMLLAQEDIPIVLDQPEDELDNEFVFHELVPLLRKIKEKRQVIVVTHNANIPVNADAELIVALEVRNQRGQPKLFENIGTAVGALDQTAVKLAVESIMEGSEEAFRRRFEKYGF